MLPGARGTITPFERLLDVRRDLDRLFEGANVSNGSTLWTPPMDIVERENEILCHIEVPGMSRNDLDIRVEGNVVTVAGEKNFQQDTDKEGFRHMERRYGRFERSFTIPATVEQEKVTARYDNGVL